MVLNGTKYDRKIEAAIAAAHCSAGVGGKNGNFRIGAALYDGKRLIVAKCNSYKTTPRALRWYKYPHLHAEFAVILHAGLDNCQGLTLTVARIKRDGSLGNAKPCQECQDLINHVGIKEIIYTTDSGNYILENL